MSGAPLEMVGEGLLARIFQHETDHLDGMLFIDRLDDAGRKAVLAELRRIELGLQEPAHAEPDVSVRLAFLGNDPWSVPSLRAIAARSRARGGRRRDQPAEARGAGIRLTPTPVARASRELGFPLVETDGVRGGTGSRRSEAPPPTCSSWWRTARS